MYMSLFVLLIANTISNVPNLRLIKYIVFVTAAHVHTIVKM